MAKGISFPILGYLCSTIVPSKSTAINITMLNYTVAILLSMSLSIKPFTSFSATDSLTS